MDQVFIRVLILKNAIEIGYQVTFKNTCLIWDKTGDVFKTYVSKYYKMKSDAEHEDNDVKRSIAKLLLNALYGKTLQKAIYDTTTIEIMMLLIFQFLMNINY